MPKTVMTLTTFFCLAAAVITSILYNCFYSGIYLTLAITFGTISYHLGMRLLVGLFYNAVMKNQADYTKKWFQVSSFEEKLYQVLNVKKWKNKMPTFYPDSFSTKKHSWNEIAQTMCQSELVHETNMLLSFLPIIASMWFGSFYVFLITSICACIFDFVFVIMQRYNRTRIIKIVLKRDRLYNVKK